MAIKSKIKENPFLIEPFRFIAALRVNWWMFIIGVAVFGSLGVYLAKQKEAKSWSTTAKVIRYEKKISQSKDVPYQFQNFNYETALETIRTRENLEELIQDLNLTDTPESLFSRFEIKRGRNSDIIEIIFTSDDANKTARIANTLAEIFIKNFSKVQNAAIERIYTYYEGSKEEKLRDLEQAKDAIDKFLKKNNLLSLVSELEMKYLQLNKLELKAIQNETDTRALKSTIIELENAMKDLPDVVKLRYAVRSANKKTLELKEKELKRMAKIYTKRHPKIKMLQSEIAQIKSTIAQSKDAAPDEVTYGNNPIKSNMQVQLQRSKIEYITAQKAQKTINSQIATLKVRIAHLNELKKNYDKLIDRQTQAQEELQLVSNRLYNIQIAIGSSKEDFKFFEHAKVPRYPAPTMKKLLIIMLAFFGFIFTLAFIIIKEFLSNSVKTSFDLTERFGIEDVVQLPKVNRIDNAFKQRFSYLANNLIASDSSDTKLIVIGSDVKEAESPEIHSMLLEQLVHQKKRTLYIEAITKLDEETADAALVFSKELAFQNFLPHNINSHIDKIYWHLEENYSIFVPDAELVYNFFDEFREIGYDYVIVKAAPYLEAEHLNPIVLEIADTFLLETKFNISTRKLIHQFLLRVPENSIEKIKGVINATNKHFLS